MAKIEKINDSMKVIIWEDEMLNNTHTNNIVNAMSLFSDKKEVDIVRELFNDRIRYTFTFDKDIPHNVLHRALSKMDLQIIST